MKLLDIKTFTNEALKKIKEVDLGDKIELLTFKKDRKLVIVKVDNDFFDIIEDGFEQKEFKGLNKEGLEKALINLKKIEFPRSNKFFLNIIKN